MTENASPADLLSHVHRAARHTRAAAWAAWFPLVVFGVLVLGSAWLYRDPFSLVGVPRHLSSYSSLDDTFSLTRRLDLFAGGGSPRREASIYWAVAAPLGYALCAWWYARRGRRTGVVPPWPAYVAPGLALFAVIALAVVLAEPGPSPQYVLSPISAVGVGFVVLGRLHRSRALVGFAAGYTALAALVSATVLRQWGSTAAWNSPFLTVLALGLLPVAAGVVALVAQRRSLP